MNKLTGTLRRLDANDPLYLDDPDAPPPPPVAAMPEHEYLDPHSDVIMAFGGISIRTKLPHRKISPAVRARIEATYPTLLGQALDDITETGDDS